MIKMEIMLGMAQEEQIPCLLCVLPRCVCHITIELTKLDLTLRKLEAGQKEKEQEAKDEQGGAELDQEETEDQGRVAKDKEVVEK